MYDKSLSVQLYVHMSVCTGDRGGWPDNSKETTCQWESMGQVSSPLHHSIEWQRHRSSHQDTGKITSNIQNFQQVSLNKQIRLPTFQKNLQNEVGYLSVSHCA